MASFVLQDPWAIYVNFRTRSNTYTNSLKCIGRFSSIESFWQHINSISVLSLPPNTNVRIFKRNIRPEYEAEENRFGGRICFNIGQSDVLVTVWESLLTEVCGRLWKYYSHINGVCLCVKDHRCSIQIWVRNAADTKAIKHLQDSIKSACGSFKPKLDFFKFFHSESHHDQLAESCSDQHSSLDLPSRPSTAVKTPTPPISMEATGSEVSSISRSSSSSTVSALSKPTISSFISENRNSTRKRIEKKQGKTRSTAPEKVRPKPPTSKKLHTPNLYGSLAPESPTSGTPVSICATSKRQSTVSSKKRKVKVQPKRQDHFILKEYPYYLRFVLLIMIAVLCLMFSIKVLIAS
ncbi:hypothetical protein P9112_014148 [Eukaryota sp. TZLM1-RC]